MNILQNGSLEGNTVGWLNSGISMVQPVASDAFISGAKTMQTIYLAEVLRTTLVSSLPEITDNLPLAW
ncbi:MAG: hypothetical protein ACFCU1_11515 [Sumerlaeia bacterium]